MKLGAAFLADAAMPNGDGTFMIWRGGVNETLAPGFPAPVRYVLVLRLEFDDQEIRQLHYLSLSTYYAGQQVGDATIPLAVREIPGETRYYANFFMEIRFMAASEGEGHIQAVIDGEMRLPQQHFRVRRGMPPTAPSPPI